MLEKESDLSIFAEALPMSYDQFRHEASRWFDNIPDMPYPGMARAHACKSYDRMFAAFTKSQAQEHALTREDIQQIFDADKQQLTRYIKMCPDDDYTLKNVLAIGVWYEREEFEKEESRTTRYQMIKQVNALVRQAIDPTISAQLPPPLR